MKQEHKARRGSGAVYVGGSLSTSPPETFFKGKTYYIWKHYFFGIGGMECGIFKFGCWHWPSDDPRAAERSIVTRSLQY